MGDDRGTQEGVLFAFRLPRFSVFPDTKIKTVSCRVEENESQPVRSSSRTTHMVVAINMRRMATPLKMPTFLEILTLEEGTDTERKPEARFQAHCDVAGLSCLRSLEDLPLFHGVSVSQKRQTKESERLQVRHETFLDCAGKFVPAAPNATRDSGDSYGASESTARSL